MKLREYVQNWRQRFPDLFLLGALRPTVGFAICTASPLDGGGGLSFRPFIRLFQNSGSATVARFKAVVTRTT